MRQSNELLSGQLTLLPGLQVLSAIDDELVVLWLEQVQQMSMLVLSRLYTQQLGQGRPQGLPGKQMTPLIS